jgi:hypothetical protein
MSHPILSRKFDSEFAMGEISYGKMTPRTPNKGWVFAVSSNKAVDSSAKKDERRSCSEVFEVTCGVGVFEMIATGGLL